MAPFEYPNDKKTAEKALYNFPSFASNGAYLQVFSEAVRILYGRNYEIVTDVNKRMSFFCIACSKTMNSPQALMGHNNSALHLKTADRYKGDYGGGLGASCSNLLQKYPADSLQYDLLRNNSMILGVHLVEIYTLYRRCLPYFKCILCGAHGKRDAIYKHLMGDKHTDRYIRYSIEINTACITTEERMAYRKSLSERDGLEVDKIVHYTDRGLYPFRWEQEGLSESALVKKNQKFGRFSPSHDSRHRDSDRHSSRSRHSRSPSSNRSSSVNRHSRQDSDVHWPRVDVGDSAHSSSSSMDHRLSYSSSDWRFQHPQDQYHSRDRSSSDGPHREHERSGVKVETPTRVRGSSSENEDDIQVKVTNLLREISTKNEQPTKATPIATPGGVIIHRDNTVMKHHQEVQVYTDWAIDRCLLKLNFIVHTSALKSSQVSSQEDVKHCLRLMFNVGLLLQFSLIHMKKSGNTRRKLELIDACKTSLNKMQGNVKYIMADRWNKDNGGNCLDDLSPVEDKRQQRGNRREPTETGHISVRSFARPGQDDVN